MSKPTYEELEAENARLRKELEQYTQLKYKLWRNRDKWVNEACIARYWARRLKRQLDDQDKRLEMLGELAKEVNTLIGLYPTRAHWWGKDMCDFVRHLQDKER